MKTKIIVVGPKDVRWPTKKMINTTSKSGQWSQLSPFLLGPVKLWGNHVSLNMENAWQYSKVYTEHAWYEEDSQLSKPWLKWAKKGWANPQAVRYPKGKGAKPEYAYWDGQNLDYREARAKIYIPLYAQLVRRTAAYDELEKLYRSRKEIILWDFDGYNHHEFGMTLLDVLACPTRKMGHAFVLAMMLEWGETFYKK